MQGITSTVFQGISQIPNEIFNEICSYLPRKYELNFSMVMDRQPPNPSYYSAHGCADLSLFGKSFCDKICNKCIKQLPLGFCYLDMLSARRLPVMMVLGAYPTLKKLKTMRIALKKICLDDFKIYSIPETRFIDYSIKPTCSRSVYAENELKVLHISRTRYSYGESDFEQVFSLEELRLFGADLNIKSFDEEIEDIILTEDCDPNNMYYHVMGSEDVIRKLDNERDIMSSGYTVMEEANIIQNFKRRIDLGIPVEDAMKSSIGIDTWTLRRQGMSGIKRFIESRICDISRSYGKKPRRKLNTAQQELLKMADEHVLDEVLYEKEIRTNDLKSSITRASLATIRKDALEPIIADVKIIRNKRSLDAESFVSMSDMGNVIADIAKKVNTDLDNIQEKNRMDARLDDMILKAGQVQNIYDDLLSHGSTSKDPLVLKRSIEGIHNIYNNLVKDEIESLERYGEVTKELVDEYKKQKMFDLIPDVLKQSKITQDINSLIDNFGTDDIKTKVKAREEKEKTETAKDHTEHDKDRIVISDDTDISCDERTSFLFQQSEKEAMKELEIVNEVEALMTKKYNQRNIRDDRSITKEECLEKLYSNFGINCMEEVPNMNRTKKELFGFMYRRVMYIFGFNVVLKYPEDPAKSSKFFEVFLKFYSRYLDNKTILRTTNSNIGKFWKNLFSGGGNKDIYKIPAAPNRTIYVHDEETTETKYQEKLQSMERKKQYNQMIMERNDGFRKELGKLKEKLDKIDKAEIPKGFKMQAVAKTMSRMKSLRSELASQDMHLIEEVYRTPVEKEIPNPEYEAHNHLFRTGTRRDFIKAGWVTPMVELTPSDISKRIKLCLEDSGLYDNKYRVRLDLDSKFMLRETDSNDYWKKIYIREDSRLEMNADDFLKKTVKMFMDNIESNMSGKASQLVRYICAGQETRILCCMVSYFCYGYISKKFIPLRKKHRRDICLSLDKLIK